MTRRPRPDGSKLEDWIEPLTLRGRWGRVDSSNKGFVDRGAVDDVASAFAAEFGVMLHDVREGDDPPDVTALANGNAVSIELVEFLHESVREREAKRQLVAFDDRLWTAESTVTKLNFLLDKKHSLYARRSDGFVADILLIHSCELWLNALDVETWLAEAVFKPRSTIRSCYFALERLPDYQKDHWPLFKLYGQNAVWHS